MKFTDKEMIDFLEVQLAKKRYTGNCVFRISNNGRGFRLHETTNFGSFSTVRKALESAILHEKEN